MHTWRFWNRTRESHREAEADPLIVKAREGERRSGDGPAPLVRRCAGRARDRSGPPGNGIAVYVDNFR